MIHRYESPDFVTREPGARGLRSGAPAVRGFSARALAPAVRALAARCLRKPALAALAFLGLAGCNDPLAGEEAACGAARFSVEVPQSWRSGLAEGRELPGARCAAVDELAGGEGTPLYLHTMTSSAGDASEGPATRGVMVADKDHFHETFSLSGICYTGSYPSSEETNPWTPQLAHDLKYRKSGDPADGRGLQWPAGGQVKFFAYAPHRDEAPEGSIAVSSAAAKGAPTITYTVPADVEKQVDLMAATADATQASHAPVALRFDHLLTAVRIEASEEMLAGEIVEVVVEGVYGTGSYNLGSGKWDFPKVEADGKYTIAYEDRRLENGEGSHLAGKRESLADGVLTLLMIPQRLGSGATLTVKFTDKLTGTERTLVGQLGSDDGTREWKAGRVVTYVVSPRSIHVDARFSLVSTKYGTIGSGNAENTLSLPCSGAIYDAQLTAWVEVTQNGAETKRLYASQGEKFEVAYRRVGETDWKPAASGLTPVADGDPTKGFAGPVVFDPQPVFAQLHEGFAPQEQGSEAEPYDLTIDTEGETANCYMVDAPGHYRLPLVYGNALGKGGEVNVSAYTIRRATPDGAAEMPGIKYFPNHKNAQITSPRISDHATIGDAVLVWQDSPELVQEVKLSDNKESLRFRIDGRNIAQGNALVAVRDTEGTILWSWHIWVTPTRRKQAWTGSQLTFTVQDVTDVGHTYTFTPTNLGYSDPHEADAERECPYEIRVRYGVAMTGGKDDPHNEAAFEATAVVTAKQAGIAASIAGDNTYYQWGRKDPMPPGVYDEHTTAINPDNTSNTINMRRKVLYDVPAEYVRTRTPVGKTNGATLGYTISHPNEHIMGEDYTYKNNTYFPDAKSHINFRSHWHNMQAPEYEGTADYADVGNGDKMDLERMYNAWNSSAYTIGSDKASTNPVNFQKVTKTVYDPCPAGFHIPPAGAWLAFAQGGAADLYLPAAGNTVAQNATGWTMTCANGQTIRFYAVGLRDLNVKPDAKKPEGIDYENQSWVSFQEVGYSTSATINETGSVMILAFDDRAPKESAEKFRVAVTQSNNAYGMPVRPVKQQ